MFLQSVTEVVFFINSCFQSSLKSATEKKLPDRAAESRCMALCAHCTCRSTTPPRKLSAHDWKGTMAT